MSMNVILFAILGALLFSSSGATPFQNELLPQAPQTLCVLLNKLIPAVVPDPLNLPPITLPLDLGNEAQVTFYVQNMSIIGLKTISFENCTVDGQLTYISDKIKNLIVDIGYYNVTGQMVSHIDIYGSGPASIKIKDFFFAIYGNFTSSIPGFDYLQTDLSIYQWAVNFQGFMDGTDMGALFNEFMSMTGPETVEAIQGLFNKKNNEQFTNFINEIIFKIISSPP